MKSATNLPVRSGRAIHGPVSIRSYLLLMIAAILVPMLALTALLAWQYATAARRTIEAERLDVANNLTGLIDREIGTLAGLLSGFSVSPGFRAGDPGMVETITNVARERGFQALGVFDRAGHLQFATPADQQATFAPADRVGVAEIVAGRKLFVSDLQVTSGGRAGLFYLSVPIMIDGQVALVLTGGVPPQQLQGLFAEAGLREQWQAAIVDRNGVLMARSRESLAYVGHLAQQPMVDAARGTKMSVLFDVVSRDGIEVKNAFQRSALTGLSVGVAVPASVVNGPFRSTALMLVVVAVSFILVSVLLGVLVARRIARDVHQLGNAVVAYATGDVVPLPAATLTELRDVLRVVEAAAAMGGDRAAIRQR